MSQYNSAAEGNLHSFHTPWAPMTGSRAEATGGNMQLPGGGEPWTDVLEMGSGCWPVGWQVHSQWHQSRKAGQQPALTRAVPEQPQLSQDLLAPWLGAETNARGHWEVFPAVSSKLQSDCQGRGHFTRLLGNALGNSWSPAMVRTKRRQQNRATE